MAPMYSPDWSRDLRAQESVDVVLKQLWDDEKEEEIPQY